MLSVPCPRGKHLFAKVTQDDAGRLWLDMPRFGARVENNWKGTPKRVQLEQVGEFEFAGSGHRVGCACGRWALLGHQLVLEAIQRGDDTLTLE